MSSIAVPGAGRGRTTLAARLAAANDRVTLGSREPGHGLPPRQRPGRQGRGRQAAGRLGRTSGQIVDVDDVTTDRGAEALILLEPHIVEARGFKPFALGLIA